ncbi:hypothetical protein [Synechococcus sp. MIT S9507]|uniref:hypothetical protein n=1 Tax=Synechococcus sp. MIT S9507 TaxID=3082544 RepID=UPI0039B60B1A
MLLDSVVRAQTRHRLPVVLSTAEVRAVREQLQGPSALVVGVPIRQWVAPDGSS